MMQHDLQHLTPVPFGAEIDNSTERRVDSFDNFSASILAFPTISNIKVHVELRKTQSSGCLLAAISHEITQSLTQNTKWAKKDVCLVCFLNLFEMNVKQQLFQS